MNNVQEPHIKCLICGWKQYFISHYDFNYTVSIKVKKNKTQIARYLRKCADEIEDIKWLTLEDYDKDKNHKCPECGNETKIF